MPGPNTPLNFKVTLEDGVSGPAAKASGALDKVGGKLRDAKGRFVAAGGAAEDLGGNIEGLGGTLEGLGLTSVAVEGAILAVGAAAAAAAVALSAFAFSVADEQRNLELSFGALLGNAEAGKELAAVTNELAGRLPIAESRIEEMAKALALAGLQGAQLKATLETLGTVASVAGDAAASKLENLVKKMSAAGKFDLTAKGLTGTGLSMPDVLGELAKQMGKSLPEVQALMKAGKVSVEQGLAAINAAAKTRFGGALEKQMLSFDVQISKAKENLEDLFKNINIEPFLKSLQDVLSLLDENSATGKALQEMFTQVFSGLFAILAKLGPYIKAFFKGMIIGVLQIYVLMKPVGKAIKEAFGGLDGEGVTTVLKVAKYLTEAFIVVLGVLMALGAIVMAPFITAVAAVVAVIALVSEAIDYVGDHLQELATLAALPFVAMLAALDWVVDGLSELGSNMMSALVSAITGAAGAVVDAISGAVGGAIDAAKSLLGIHSPSKVFEGIGKNTALGMAGGIESGAPEVHTSVKGMAGGAVDAASSAGGGKSGPSVQIGSIVINGIEDAAGAKRGVLEALAEAFGPMALEAGL